MVDKKQVHKSIRQLQRVKTWQLLILLILAAFLAATFLRLNNIGMVERRTAVYDADSAGDSQIIINRLYDLQRYVTGHMNTDLGDGISLEASYARDVQIAFDRVQNDSDIYQKAQDVCAPKYSHWSQAYVQCTISELAKYPSASDVVMPDLLLYNHNYVSPLWSPDFAGWTVLVFIAILTMIIIRLISVATLKLLLKRHNKGI